MFIVDVLDKIYHYILRKELKEVREIIPYLLKELEKECIKLGIDPSIIEGIYPYRFCSTYVRRSNGKFLIKIYCGENDNEKYTLSQARRILRHELAHIKGEINGKEVSELKATIYEIFGYYP